MGSAAARGFPVRHTGECVHASTQCVACGRPSNHVPCEVLHMQHIHTNAVMLMPTGVAATNVKDVTLPACIHTHITQAIANPTSTNNMTRTIANDANKSWARVRGIVYLRYQL